MNQMILDEAVRDGEGKAFKGCAAVPCLEMEKSHGALWSGRWSCAMCVCVITVVTLAVHFGFEGPQRPLKCGSEQRMFGLRWSSSVSAEDQGLMWAVVKLIKKASYVLFLWYKWIVQSFSHELVQCSLNKILYTEGTVKATTPQWSPPGSFSIRAVRRRFFISAPPGVSYLTRPVEVWMTLLYT